MATRDDISVEWYLSPRIVVVQAPSTEVTIQDLHDTLRELEQRVENMDEPSIISTAGKEELGGGVAVGLTSTLQNARLSFEARKMWTSTGSVTLLDPTGTTLTDGAATFVSDGIQSGATVVNLTDGSVCSVRVVLSETDLLTDTLGGGSDNQFEIGDDYRVRNVTQTNISGGNLVALDVNGAELDPVLPTAGTQVVRTSSSSATLLEILDIQVSSFNGGVLVDVLNTTGLAGGGTVFPTGTFRRPVDNFEDAITIAQIYGFKEIRVLGQGITLNSGLDYRGYQFYGQSPSSTSMTVASAALVESSEFYNMTVDGVFDGLVRFAGCILGTTTIMGGNALNSGLQGVITLSGGASFALIGCYDTIAGAGIPVLDFGGVGATVILRDFQGGISMRNKSGSNEVSIDLTPGRIILESTISGGAFIIKGTGTVDDQSTGTTTIDTTALVSPEASASATWNHNSTATFGSGTFGKDLLRGKLR